MVPLYTQTKVISGLGISWEVKQLDSFSGFERKDKEAV
jgi:hypothetical protein